MQKKILVIATSLAMSSPLYASDVSYYAGGGIMSTNLETDYNSRPKSPFFGENADDSATALKLFGGVKKQAGMGFYGFEAAYEDGQSKVIAAFVEIDPLKTQRGVIEDKASFSLSFLGGYEIYRNSYLTGRVGYIRTNFDYETSDRGIVYSSDDKSMSGIQYGVGVEHHYSNNVGIRIEYTMSAYSGSINTIANQPCPCPPGSGDLSEFDDISRDAISIGIFANF